MKRNTLWIIGGLAVLYFLMRSGSTKGVVTTATGAAAGATGPQAGSVFLPTTGAIRIPESSTVATDSFA